MAKEAAQLTAAGERESERKVKERVRDRRGAHTTFKGTPLSSSSYLTLLPMGSITSQNSAPGCQPSLQHMGVWEPLQI